MSRPRLGSTYRLQLHGLGLRNARALIPYLADLGIETLYLSPVLAAVPGSTHGYDVVDPSRLDPQLGTEEDLEELLSTLVAHQMHAIVDIVPNHMAADRSNRRWWDVLRRGATSRDAIVFDIDWSRHGGRVLVPFLDRPLGDILAEGAVVVDERERLIDLGGTTLPLSDQTVSGAVDSVLAAQHYRPAYWRVGATEGNYRRFFDIAALIGVRVEDPDVFERTHERLRALARHPAVVGVRVDHIDGLADPAQYLERLRAYLEGSDGPQVTILVEKILGPDETIDNRWDVDGTTGYEFADRVIALFVDPDGSAALRGLGAELTGCDDPGFAALARQGKRQLLEQSFSGDLDRLTRLSYEALDSEAPGHDLSQRDLRRAWMELTVHLDVYRTYLDAGGASSCGDRARVGRAAQTPGAGHGPTNEHTEVLRAQAMVVRGLLGDLRTGSPWLEVARRWQQLSGAVMAKGVEDTATYRYSGLAARADVGGDPDAVVLPAAFHEFVMQRTKGLNSTSTHDSKRNEDARCRLAVLSEADAEWTAEVRRWHHRYASEDMPAPGPLEELRAYETLFTLWPPASEAPADDMVERARNYTLKAAREAKLRTSWTEPDESYEQLVTSFIPRVCRDSGFRKEMSSFSASIDAAALCNTLALVVLKACCPGVPDFFQGTEFLDPVLTDPDNRRPVDFAARAAALATMPGVSGKNAARLLSGGRHGPIKLYVTRALLAERRRSPDLFDRGSYHALQVTTEHAVAWARELDGQRLLAVVPRLTLRLTTRAHHPVGPDVWGDATVDLPEGWNGPYRDLFTGRIVTARSERLDLGEVLEILPVAVLRLG